MESGRECEAEGQAVGVGECEAKSESRARGVKPQHLGFLFKFLTPERIIKILFQNNDSLNVISTANPGGPASKV